MLAAEDARRRELRRPLRRRAFPIKEKEGAPKLQEVAGTLVVDKATLRPRRFVVANTETLSPAPTVKMQEFRQEIDFAVDAATGALIFESMRFAMRGRAMVFKKINEEVTLRPLDYDCRT